MTAPACPPLPARPGLPAPAYLCPLLSISAHPYVLLTPSPPPLLHPLSRLLLDEWVEFFLEFIPMCVFAFGLFGYMIVVIFIKWSIDWQHRMYLGTCNEDNAHW